MGHPITPAEALAAVMLHCLDVGRRESKTIDEGGNPVREVLVPDQGQIAATVGAGRGERGKRPPPRWEEALREAERLVEVIGEEGPSRPQSLPDILGAARDHFVGIHEGVKGMIAGLPSGVSGRNAASDAPRSSGRTRR